MQHIIWQTIPYSYNSFCKKCLQRSYCPGVLLNNAPTAPTTGINLTGTIESVVGAVGAILVTQSSSENQKVTSHVFSDIECNISKKVSMSCTL